MKSTNCFLSQETQVFDCGLALPARNTEATNQSKPGADISKGKIASEDKMLAIVYSVDTCEL
jgi:hypothetical protein